jgi:hypothetical protein
MKVDPMTKGLRVVMTVAEARILESAMAAMLVAMPERDKPPHLLDITARLRVGADDVERRQREARARRDAPKIEAARRKAVERHLVVDGCTVIARLGDWIDVSRDPDFRIWGNARMAKPNEQAEIVCGVWNVIALNPDRGSDNVTAGQGITATGDPAEIEPVARRVIAEAIASGRIFPEHQEIIF